MLPYYHYCILSSGREIKLNKTDKLVIHKSSARSLALDPSLPSTTPKDRFCRKYMKQMSVKIVAIPNIPNPRPSLFVLSKHVETKARKWGKLKGFKQTGEKKASLQLFSITQEYKKYRVNKGRQRIQEIQWKNACTHNFPHFEYRDNRKIPKIAPKIFG